MDKNTFQELINGEHDALLINIDRFRNFLPHDTQKKSVHSGEEGRFIELAFSQYLKDKLPTGIGVGSGFVVDIEQQWNSRQIDVLLYDAVRFSPIVKYGDAVVIPSQAVIAALSIKRTLYADQVPKEINALREIGSRTGGNGYPKPYLSIVAFGDHAKASPPDSAVNNFELLVKEYQPKIDRKGRNHLYSWNEMIDSMIVFDKFLIVGTNFRPDDEKVATSSKYLWTGGDGNHRSVYIQHIMNGIHRAWYDPRRGNSRVNNLLAMPQINMSALGKIDFCIRDRPYVWGKFA